jgi:hypothetical protein
MMVRRGAVIPGGWSSVVVAEDDGSSRLRVVFVESFEAGQLVPRVPGGLKSMERVFSEAEVGLFVNRVMQRFQEMQVESVLIEWATSKKGHAHELATAIREACEASGIAWAYAKHWRIWDAHTHRPWVNRRIADGYTAWPSETFEVQKNCGVMLLESINPERPEQLPPVPKEARHDPSRANPESAAAASNGLGTNHEQAGERAAVAPRTPSPRPLGPRTAGIDPGAVYLGLVIVEGHTKPLQLVFKRTFAVGEWVALKKPRKVNRGGEMITIRNRHSLTAEMAKTLATSIVGVLLEHHVTKLAIEHVESVHFDAKSVRSGSSIATHLIRTSWLDMLIGDAAQAAGIEVQRVKAATWRARVAGRRKRGGAGAELIPAAVAKAIDKWPPGTDDHENDAGGVAIWLAVPPPPPPAPAERRPRAPRTAGKKVNGERPPSYYVRLEESRKKTEAARTASGCTCANRRRGRHRIGCPLGHPNRPREVGA